MTRPLIVKIARHRLEDGPGVRSVVFFKGCPLRCQFCQNLETQSAGAEIAYFERNCIECDQCVRVCENGAINRHKGGRIDRRRCTRCCSCTKVCPSGALQQLGRYYEPQELAALLLRDKSYYRLSSGGVTLSGGECLQYPEYLQALLMILKRENIHLALQTAGYFDYDACEHSVFPYVAVVYFDVKIMNSSKHKFYTGRGNSLILENLTRLAGRKDLQLRPRVPLIPGITTSSENLTAIAEFLVKIGVQKVSFLPYNPLGLSMVNPLGGVSPPLLNRFLSAKEHEDILSVCASIFRNFEIG